jgi:voltage-gated potassium channel
VLIEQRRMLVVPRQQRGTWTRVLRLSVVLVAVSAVVVLGGGTALWFVEGGRPPSSLRSWGDAVWLALTTMTTVGYGDHVPVTTTGRLIAAAVIVVGVAFIGAVAAVVALAVARRVALEEEQELESQAGTLEHQLEVRLDRIEAQLDALSALYQRQSPSPADDDTPGVDRQQR